MNAIVDKIKRLRPGTQKGRTHIMKEQLEHPISFWTKNDRLLKEMGREFTIILRTKG